MALSSFSYHERRVSFGWFGQIFNITVKYHEYMRHGRTCIGNFCGILTMYGASIMSQLHKPWHSSGSVSSHSRVGIMHLYNRTIRGPPSICLPGPILVLSEASPQISHLFLFNHFFRSLQMSSNPETSNPLNSFHSTSGFSKKSFFYCCKHNSSFLIYIFLCSAHF